MISYHGVVGFKAKTTLPSVETWGNNMNILRDPPKSITTRKIDRVGQTSEITQMIQESGDRACEAINVYARGVNPMVAVSYDNNGNNGGQRSGGTKSAGMVSGSTNSGKQSFLPYRIMDRGAFRPPIRDQRDLLPLSRLPRIWTSSFTKPGFADFSKKAFCAGTDETTRQVKNPSQMLKGCVRPTMTYQLETPVKETYEVKNVIKNPLQVEANSGFTSQARFNGERVLNEASYTHDVLQGEYGSNVSKNIQAVSVLNKDVDKNIKETFNISHEGVFSGIDKNEYIHSDIALDRVLPVHEARTNIGQSVFKRAENQVSERQYTPNRPLAFAETNFNPRVGRLDDISSRDFSLKPRVNPGEFEAKGNMPLLYRENGIVDVDRQKQDFRNRVFEMQSERYN